MITRIEVEADDCIGCGTCWSVCPEGFAEMDLGTDLKAVPTGALGTQEVMQAAAECCPSLAISIFDDSGTMLYPEVGAREAWRMENA